MIRRLLALGITLFATGPALAEDVKLPPTMAVTAYDTGTAGSSPSASAR
jgi:hypothetical protein